MAKFDLNRPKADCTYQELKEYIIKLHMKLEWLFNQLDEENFTEQFKKRLGDIENGNGKKQ